MLSISWFNFTLILTQSIHFFIISYILLPKESRSERKGVSGMIKMECFYARILMRLSYWCILPFVISILLAIDSLFLLNTKIDLLIVIQNMMPSLLKLELTTLKVKPSYLLFLYIRINTKRSSFVDQHASIVKLIHVPK